MKRLNYELFENLNIDANITEYENKPFLIVDSWEDLDLLVSHLSITDLDELIDWGFSDEFMTCGDCNCAINYYNDKYFIDSENGTIQCLDCLDNNEYLDYIINNPNRANKGILNTNFIIENGFVLYKSDYEYGLYGVNDNPEAIFNEINDKFESVDILFNISDSNPFAINFDAYIRKQEC